jgi:dTDP-glucose pyrophosphorylase
MSDAVPAPTQAVILVGGRGTRLGSVTDTLPKPMAPISGRPFLDWQIDEVARFGFTHILLLAGYKGEQIVACYHGRVVRGARIEVAVEPQPMGTGGALKQFADRLEARFLLLNGDTLFDINLLDLPRHAGSAVAALALRRTAPGGRFGTVSLAEDGTIRGFAAGPTASGGPINGGIYTLSRQVLDWIGDGMVSLEQEVFPRLASAGLLRGHLYDGRFIDIGIPEDLERGQREIVEIATRPAAFLSEDGVLLAVRGPSVVHPSGLQWIDGAARAIERLNQAGFLVFVIIGQADREGMHALLRCQMAAQLGPLGAHIDAFVTGVAGIEDLLTTWPVRRAHSFVVSARIDESVAAEAAGLPAHHFPGGALDRFILPLIAADAPVGGP